VSDTTITVRDNGNLRISGSFEIVDAAGNVFPVEPGRPVFLCRCGHSQSKPFCDGSHSRVGFGSVVRAPVPEVTGGSGSDAAAEGDAGR
jgi:CDGSH-type Zn-finger protein